MNVKKIKEQRAVSPTDSERFYIREEFECGKYTVVRTATNYSSKNKDYTAINYSITRGDGKYLPRIYYNDWSCLDENATPKFTIQTTAYGDLNPEEIREMIKGYEEAIEVVEALNKKFIEQEEYNSSHDAYLAFVLGYDLLHDELANSDNPENDLCFEHCLNLVKEFKKSDEFKDLSISEYEALKKWLDSRA